MNKSSTAMVKVWDPIVRIGHWVLVITFSIAYFLGGKILWLHVWCGYILGLVVAVRIIWGFVGPQRARFRDFVFRPKAAITYGFELLNLRSRRYIGHSPAGGLMIVATLAMLIAIVYTGLVAYALESNQGPLSPFVKETPAVEAPTDNAAAGTAQADQSAAVVTEWKKSDDPAARERRRFWKELHEALSNTTMILIILHIGGVALASYAHRENLIRAMITGKKRPEAGT